MATGALDWFVAEGSAGFTSDPDQAKKTRNGHPIACPGGLNQVWKAHYKQDKDRQEAIWEMLLDEMEKVYELDDAARDDHDAHERAHVHRACAHSLRDALAVLKYGLVNSDTHKAIMSEAHKRYDA